MSDSDEAIDEINRALADMEGLDIDNLADTGIRQLEMDYAMTIAANIESNESQNTADTEGPAEQEWVANFQEDPVDAGYQACHTESDSEEEDASD